MLKINNKLLMGISTKINRRKFIATGALGLIGLPLISTRAWSVAPSDRVRVAVIGLGGQGRGHMNWFNDLPDVEVAALCDLDKIRLEEARAQLQKLNPESKAEIFTDFRHVLDRKDIDAITCATPDHWHALIAILAFQSGKDVYGEKPLTYSLAEGQAMLKNLEKYNRVFQLGTQIHAGNNYHRVAELIQSGKLGKIHTVRLWKTGGSPGLGFPPSQKPPETLDWDLWLGPAPSRSFNRNRFHGVWRMFWDYGGGLMSDWGVHLIDIALWAKDITTGPEKVLVYGANTFEEPRMRETFDSMNVIYPKDDFVINWDMTAGIQSGPYESPYGLACVGDLGTLTVDRNKLIGRPEWDSQAKKGKTEEYKFTEGTESHQQHAMNFLECIRTRNKPVCTPEMGRAAAIHVHIPNIAARCGESMLIWDDEAGRFTNSEMANKYITPEYRKPWTLPLI